MQDIVNGRCGWCGTDELYMRYHDQEWGRLVTDDKTLFEFLVLENIHKGRGNLRYEESLPKVKTLGKIMEIKNSYA